MRRGEAGSTFTFGGVGWQKSPTPIIGKAGSVSARSPGLSAAASLVLLSLMFCSTRLRSAVYPPYGTRGVPSTIQAAYSGCHEHAFKNKNKR